MGASPIVCIRELSKVYRQGEIHVTALNQISVDIAAGEFLTLMGPSGSGKSTLLHIIAGIDRPTSGSCRVQDIDLTQLNESQLADWRNRNVGFVFQTFNLIPVLTAFENVELPLLLTRLKSAQRRQQVQTALELVGLADRQKHLPKQLSGGQEQRVASPARWSPTRCWWWRTNRRATWTRSPRRRCCPFYNPSAARSARR